MTRPDPHVVVNAHPARRRRARRRRSNRGARTPGVFRKPRLPSRAEVRGQQPTTPDADPSEETVSSPVCSKCDGDIAVDNRRFPGYCSAHCRQKAHEQGDRAATDLAQRRADRRQQHAAHQPVAHYCT